MTDLLFNLVWLRETETRLVPRIENRRKYDDNWKFLLSSLRLLIFGSIFVLVILGLSILLAK